MSTAPNPVAVDSAVGRRLPLTAVLVASTVSVSCTAVSAIAVRWLVLSTGGSGTRTGLVVFAELAPYVVLQAVGGPWVERFGPRRMSWLANLCAGAALLVLPSAYLTGALDFGVLVVVVAAVGALRGLADCGSAPLVPGTAALAGTALERAAGLHASASQAGQLLGAALAAVLLSLIAPPVVLVLSGTGFLVAAGSVWLLVPVEVGAALREDGEPESYLRRLGAGMSFIAKDPVLRALVIMIAATNLLSAGFIGVLLPSWVRDNDLPVAAVGAVTAALGIGALSGSLLGAWLAPRVDRWLAYSLGYLIGGSPLFLALALSHSLLPAVVVAAGCGLAAGGVNPVVGAVQYERIPEAMLPRVLGVVKAAAWAGLPIGPIIAGLLTDTWSVQSALAGMGLVYLVLTLAPFVVPAFRQMRSPAAAH